MKTAAMILAVLAATAAPAASQTISASNPSTIVKGLQDLGYVANLDVDGTGDPMIKSSASGANFFIYFYGCTSNANCQDIQFSQGFNRSTPMTAAKMNEWNRTYSIGKAFIDDEGDPFIQHFVSGATDLSPASFERTVARWTAAFGSFMTFIDW